MKFVEVSDAITSRITGQGIKNFICDRNIPKRMP